jgi:hypothetical protein
MIKGRRLEDRIQELCRRAVERDWPQILAELRLAFQQHALRVANRTVAAVMAGRPQIMRERRHAQHIPSDLIPMEYEGQNRQPAN